MTVQIGNLKVASRLVAAILEGPLCASNIGVEVRLEECGFIGRSSPRQDQALRTSDTATGQARQSF
jgi:hypothetical protein